MKPDEISFPAEGFFWLGNESDDTKKVPGKITFSQDSGIRLVLLGTFTTASLSSQTDAHNVAIVHGFTVSGQLVTLVECHSAGGSLQIPGINTRDYITQVLLFGLHLESKEEECFGSGSISFDGIERWLGHNYHARQIGDNNTFTVVSKNPEVNRFRLSANDAEIVLSSSLSNNTDHVVATSRGNSEIKINFAQPANYAKIISNLQIIRSLASICYVEPLSLRYIRLKYVQPSPTNDDILFFHNDSTLNSEEMPWSSYPILRLDLIIKNDPEVLNRWFNVSDRFDVAIDLLYTLVSSKSSYVEARFLLAIQTFEVLHRKILNGNSATSETYQNFATKLIESVDPATDELLREKLRSWLRFGYEPSLRQRLGDVLTQLEAAFGSKPLGLDRKTVSKIVNTRNYLTHYSQIKPADKLSVEEMYHTSQALIITTLFLIFRELRVKENQIARFLWNRLEFHRYIGALPTSSPPSAAPSPPHPEPPGS